MKLKLATALFLLSTLPLSMSASAHQEALRECAQIASALDRLDCYDAYARGLHEPASPSPSAASSAAVDPAASATLLAPSQSVRDEESQTGSARFEDRFGFDDSDIDDERDEITSKYDGAFTGWSGQTLFRLENGQVWKQSQSGRVSFRSDRPEITIRKGAFGSYRLSVEGLNRTIRVERVK